MIPWQKTLNLLSKIQIVNFNIQTKVKISYLFLWLKINNELYFGIGVTFVERFNCDILFGLAPEYDSGSLFSSSFSSSKSSSSSFNRPSRSFSAELQLRFFVEMFFQFKSTALTCIFYILNWLISFFVYIFNVNSNCILNNQIEKTK